MLNNREIEIIAIIEGRGVGTVKELATRFDVSEVTIRRDLSKLEDMGLLKRTHGGAVSIDENGVSRLHIDLQVANIDEIGTDALILAPVQNFTAHTLRERANRNRVPFLAESCPQEGAIYLGPENFTAAYQLGKWIGTYWQEQALPDQRAVVLDLSQYEYVNAKERSAGFQSGIQAVLKDRVEIHSINAGGLYSRVYQNAINALQIHLQVNIIFGVNDDSVLAGIQAYKDLGLDISRLVAANIGGEGNTIFNVLKSNGPLKACAGLFPDIVGQLGIDGITRIWQNEDIGGDIITPFALLTPENLDTYYYEDGSGWHLRWERLPSLVDERWLRPPPHMPGQHITFVILYRTHEWYQNLAHAMQRRAHELGIQVEVKDLTENLKDEIRELRRLIGKVAATHVHDGDSIILDTGSTTAYMTQFLRNRKDLTVITNSIDVLHALRDLPQIRIILTGGEFDPESRSLAGKGAHLFLQEVRVDKAFIVAAGVSPTFGVSSKTQGEAEVRRSMIESAREVIVLADHTVLDVEAYFRVTDLDKIHTIITDPGIHPRQSLELTQQGIKVLIAGGSEDRVTDQPTEKDVTK